MNKTALTAFCLALGATLAAPAAEESGKVIDLNKPVIESIKPDGFYWAFDDGIIGESEPRTVTDFSGNSFDGQISAANASVTPTYAEGVFGTAIYVQGIPQVSWGFKHKLNSAPDPSRLIMKGRSFTGGAWFKMDDLKQSFHALIRRDENAIGWRLIIYNENLTDKDSAGTAWYPSLEYGSSRSRGKSTVSTSVFSDGKWHHVGFSVSPDSSVGEDEIEFTTVYWLDGVEFDRVVFKAKIPDPNPETQFLSIGNGAWGLIDDAFVTTGVHTFKK